MASRCKVHGETYNLYNRSIGVLGSSILHEATIFQTHRDGFKVRHSLKSMRRRSVGRKHDEFDDLRVCDGMADVVDSKSTAERRGGSTPSIPTNLTLDNTRLYVKMKE